MTLKILSSVKMNDSSSLTGEIECYERIKLSLQQQQQRNPQEREFGCEIDWDTVLCWPFTLAGNLARLPCFEELNGIQYDSTSKRKLFFLNNKKNC